MRRRRTLLLTAALTAWTSLAHAQPVPGKEVAKKLFDEGVELEKKNDPAAALAKFREAEQITVTAGLRFHEAFCLEATNKLAAAIDGYEAALKLARDTNKPDVEKATLARLEPLRERVPFLGIRVVREPARNAPSDIQVKLDGVVIAPVLLDGKTFRLDPGDHDVTANATGFRPFAKHVTAIEGTTTTVDVVFEREEVASPPAAVDAPRDETPRRPSRVVPIAFAASAVALLGGGLASFFVAGGVATDAAKDCAKKASCDDERSRVRTLDALALAGFVGAAALGTLAVVTWSAGRKAAATPPRVYVSPAGLGLAAFGSFR